VQERFYINALDELSSVFAYADVGESEKRMFPKKRRCPRNVLAVDPIISSPKDADAPPNIRVTDLTIRSPQRPRCGARKVFCQSIGKLSSVFAYADVRESGKKKIIA
jgi:hypothetical protein